MAGRATGLRPASRRSNGDANATTDKAPGKVYNAEESQKGDEDRHGQGGPGIYPGYCQDSS